MSSETQSTWSGGDYAEHSEHHRAYDEWFLQRFPPEPSDFVLDLGCGSGEFSARMSELVPQGRVLGVDGDSSMIEHARRFARPNLAFLQAPAEQIDTVVEPDSIDLATSRAMLHWLPITSYRRCFEGVLRVLRPGGWFHSESAGSGNVAVLTAVLNEIAAQNGLQELPAFPNAAVVFDAVEAAGFELPSEAVRTVAQRRRFSRAQLLAFLRSQASVALTRQVTGELRRQITEAVIGSVERLRRDDGSYDQTFVRLEILARRPTVASS